MTPYSTRVSENSGIPLITLRCSDRVLLKEGLLTEVAPNLAIAADYARLPALRGQAVTGILRGATAITLTAAWIHTGWWPAGHAVRVCAAHPSRIREDIIYRRSIPDSDCVQIGSQRVTTPARTAADSLILERVSHACEAVLILVGSGTSLEEIEWQLDKGAKRRGIKRARTLFDAISEYVRGRELMRSCVIR